MSHSRMALVGIKLTRPVQIYNSIYTPKKEKVVQRDTIFHTIKNREKNREKRLNCWINSLMDWKNEVVSYRIDT